MNVHFTHNKIWLLLSVVWILVFYKQLSHPIALEEIDYVRFLMRVSPSNPKTWTKGFFISTDGHPPLLSLTSSALVFLTESVYILRCFLTLTCLGLFTYFFRISKKLNAPLWFTFLLSAIILFSPVNSTIISTPIGDFLGFSLILGWIYHRMEGQKLRAMFLLLAAVMIRETHALPALVYLAIETLTGREKLKNLWPEVIPVVALGCFYILCKYLTGVWYTFSSKEVLLSFSFDLFKNPPYITHFLHLLVPLFFLVIFWNQRKKLMSSEELPIYYLGVITAILAICMLVPYLISHPKARLLTPFLAPTLIAVLLLLANHPNKKTIGIGFLLSFLYFENSIYLPDYATNLKYTKGIFRYLKQLNLPSDTVVSGSWPLTFYGAHSLLGYPAQKTSQISAAFYMDFYADTLSDSSKYKKGIFFVDPNYRGEKMMEYFCRPKCESLTLKKSNSQELVIKYKNLDPAYLQQAWDKTFAY